MQENNFLEWIEIEEFKCFKNFKVEGLERVNLIGGDNNIGKTAFMEACFINVLSKDLKTILLSIFRTYWHREQLNILYSILNSNISKENMFSISNIQSFIPYMEKAISSYSYFDINSKETKLKCKKVTDDLGMFYFEFNLNDEILEFKLETINESFFKSFNTFKKINFLGSIALNEISLSIYYESIQKKNLEDELNSLIREFDSRIYKFKFIGDEPLCSFESDKNNYLSLSSFGDGLKRYISIICAIYSSENGALFIDEIENGIHYSKLDRLWEIIFKTSKEANCQVFATTHSKETIESYSRVAESFDNENIKYINFSRTAENKIVATTLDSLNLEDNFNLGFDVR